jgi:hypothetical protein
MGLAGSGRAAVFFADVCLEMEILINPNKRFCLPFGLPKRNSNKQSGRLVPRYAVLSLAPKAFGNLGEIKQ